VKKGQCTDDSVKGVVRATVLMRQQCKVVEKATMLIKQQCKLMIATVLKSNSANGQKSNCASEVTMQYGRMSNCANKATVQSCYCAKERKCEFSKEQWCQ